ncbi:hypothetical protein Lal_00016794 [Lupinus albus]|nr:hypothetical protein Lal_00016794 [Lupinus albus]
MNQYFLDKLVESGRHVIYLLVYLLLKKSFSTMKIVKNRMDKRMRDAWMTDCSNLYLTRSVHQDDITFNSNKEDI